MNAPNGFNPLRWNCGNSGCYNTVHRPKIEVFAECLPGRLAFTDVDATAEVGGRFLFLEFKGGEPRDLPVGQRIYLERLTGLSDKITAVVVCGDAETMAITAVRTVFSGRVGEWQDCDLDGLKSRIQRWAAYRPPIAKAA